MKDHPYQRFDNYDAINVPFTDAIPSDYDGVMGVPISFPRQILSGTVLRYWESTGT